MLLQYMRRKEKNLLKMLAKTIDKGKKVWYYSLDKEVGANAPHPPAESQAR